MPRSHLAYTFTGTFIICIFTLQWFQNASYGWAPWLIAVIGCSLLIIKLKNACSFLRLFEYSLSYRKNEQTNKRNLCSYTWVTAIAAMCFGMSFALFCVARTTHVPTHQTIDTFATEQFVTLRGTINAEPDRRPMQTKYTVAVHAIEIGSGVWKKVHGNVLATDKRRWPEFQYGDAVEVRGTLERPGQIETFHYDRYLSRFNIYAVMYRASFLKSLALALHPSPYITTQTRMPRTLFALKNSFESHINTLYAEPHASFMAGLLTGSRRGIPETLMEEFNITGLTHIIAISGYNITIIITIIAGMLFWLPLKWRFVPSIVAIALFTLFVGASAAVVRASIMGILGLIALQTGRQAHARLAVLWTLVFMLAWNPKYLWYDAGFQLSFLAVVGLMELGSLLDPFFKYVPTTLSIRESLQMTIAAQLSAVPLIILLFGRLSIIAPIANLLVAPFIPIAMLFGFIATVLSYVWQPLALLPAYIGWAALEWVIWVSHYCSKLPLASIDTPGIGVGVIVGYYVILVLVIAWMNRSNGVKE